MAINYKLARKHLEAFDFKKLFVEVLGWGHGTGRPSTLTIDGAAYRLTPVAELGGMAVLQCEPQSGAGQPPMPARHKIERHVSQAAFEHILIFTDRDHTAATWQWVKRGTGSSRFRQHTYTRGQPGDSLLQKLAGIAFEFEARPRRCEAARAEQPEQRRVLAWSVEIGCPGVDHPVEQRCPAGVGGWMRRVGHHRRLAVREQQTHADERPVHLRNARAVGNRPGDVVGRVVGVTVGLTPPTQILGQRHGGDRGEVVGGDRPQRHVHRRSVALAQHPRRRGSSVGSRTPPGT